MTLPKQALDISFAQGLDQKTDPKRLQAGKFEVLENSVFTKAGLLQKRSGYGALASLPNTTSTYLTTFNGNLTAIGNSISAYSSGSNQWVSKGSVQPMQVATLPLVRNSVHQTQADSVVSATGLVCTVYTETNASSTSYKYVIADSTTGQNIIAPTVIPVASGTVTGSPRVFLLGAYFILAFTNVIGGTSHLQYVAVSITSPTSVSANTDIASAYTATSGLSWDGVVANNNLYIAYNTVAGGQSVKVTYLTATLVVVTPVTFAAEKASLMTVSADVTTPTAPIIYVGYFNPTSTVSRAFAVDKNLNTVFNPTQIISAAAVANITSAAQNGSCRFFYEITQAYSYNAGIPTNRVDSVSLSQAGVLGSPYIAIRSVGLASKAFIVDETYYFLAAYQSPYQNTYFLVNGSTTRAATPAVVAKLAYQNGGGYLTTGLPGVTVSDGNIAQMPYLFRDSIAAVNKDTNPPAGTQVAGIYSQYGVNLSTFTIGTQAISTAEIGSDLHISGGFLWMYDGYLPVEHNFLLYPDSVDVSGSATGGSMAAQLYYYQVTYEWADNQGNIFRSAPSLPVPVTLTSDTSVLVQVPSLRLTYKTANKVKIVIYRWSVAQPVYYQVTSINSALLNDLTVDSVSFVDSASDATILGNNILYTTGGVLEDTNAPASSIMTLFDTRLWLVDAEDPNLLWFSKQVIEATPVEMSDLLTVYVAPNTGTSSSTGPITALAPMDDKLVIFKKDAIYYINGAGPDNTGSNNQYSQPIFITSTVGCTDQASIVLMQNGLMFQSDKGIWLLGRDLQTQYIGAPVEDFAEASTVQSAVNVPETTQVRFTLASGITLMYDYYFQQWGTFTGVPAISSCIFQSQHTYLNDLGAVFQETPDTYIDGSTPVLMKFRTGWLNLMGLQGYQRIYYMYLLGDYLTPHKLQVGISYDYNTMASQRTIISPTNFSSSTPSAFGVPVPGGAPLSLEQWRIFMAQQRCQAFQIEIQELYDGSFGVPAGAGFNLSGLNLVYGAKSKYRPIGSGNSAGGGSNRG